jgi:predicted RNase H-like nuclease
MPISGGTLAGVDGCPGGWVAVIESAGRIRAQVFARFAELDATLGPDALVAVDMPIGLPDHCHGGRGPEQLVRPLLGGRQSSVFSIPSRSAVYASTAEEARADWYGAHRACCSVARATSTPPRAVAIQGFGLFAKIRELDAFLREAPGRCERIVESHPELAFWRLNGRLPLVLPKKVKGAPFGPGLAERAALLEADGVDVAALEGVSPVLRGAARDDMLDACAMLSVARRLAAGTVESFPPDPPRDGHGLPIAIHF